MPEPIKNAVKNVGFVGVFEDSRALVKAAERVRLAGYQKWDCHTPYPVHGLDDAMGVKPSLIPAICLAAGFAGIGAALLMQWWMSAVDYPVRIGGKPLWSWPAFVPITFEFFVLFAALSTMGAMLFFCRLGTYHSRLHDSKVMDLATSDRFLIVIDGEDPQYTPERTRVLLEKSGCRDIRPLLEELEEGEEAGLTPEEAA